MKKTDILFEIPRQVKFLDDEGKECGGIGYKDEIICGCCGSIYEVGEVEIVEVYNKYWVDIDFEIRGV